MPTIIKTVPGVPHWQDSGFDPPGNEWWAPDDAPSDDLVLFGGDAAGGTATLSPVMGTSTVTGPVGAATTSPFVINVNWDSSVASAPAAFQSAVLSAIQY